MLEDIYSVQNKIVNRTVIEDTGIKENEVANFQNDRLPVCESENDGLLVCLSCNLHTRLELPQCSKNHWLSEIMVVIAVLIIAKIWF